MEKLLNINDVITKPASLDMSMLNSSNNKPKFKIKSNVMNETLSKCIIEDTLQYLSDSLSRTLGPYGSTTIIQDRFLNHTISKDGYTVLKNIYLEQEGPRTILDLVKKISRNLVRKVGDGSTSSIIVANSIYKKLIELEDLHLPPRDMLAILEEISLELITEIKKIATPLSDDMCELFDIASVSTNNDSEMATYIRDLFRMVGRYGFINVEKSKTDSTYFDNTKGFEIGRGYLHEKMVTDADSKIATYKDAYVFMVDSVLGEEDAQYLHPVIGTICLQNAKPLVILCKGMDRVFDTFVTTNLMRNPDMPLLIVDISTASKRSKERFDDLAINLGCTPLRKIERGETYPDTPQELLKYLGSCGKVISGETYTRFFEGNGDKERIEKRVKKLEEELEELDRNEAHIERDEDIYELRKRLALLQNAMVTLYVGGLTENAKDTRKYLVEDAVFACRSALKNGYVLGGNLIIPIILSKKEFRETIVNKFEGKYNKEIIEELIEAINVAFKKSFDTVLSNKKIQENEREQIINKCIEEETIYNLRSGEFEKTLSVINSAETDAEILKSALSIIGLLATSNQFITLSIVDEKTLF